MSEMNYMRQRGRAYCVHCEYETLDIMSFDEQNAAMRDHMVTAHPNWLTPEQLRVHDLLPEEERRTQERIAAVVRERDERIATIGMKFSILEAELAWERNTVKGLTTEPPTPLTWSLLAKDDPQYGRSLTGEVLGVRVLPDGRREYLCMNKALDPQRYSVMESK